MYFWLLCLTFIRLVYSYECFGDDESEPGVCGFQTKGYEISHSDCVGENICDCYPGFTGQQCKQFSKREWLWFQDCYKPNEIKKNNINFYEKRKVRYDFCKEELRKYKTFNLF